MAALRHPLNVAVFRRQGDEFYSDGIVRAVAWKDRQEYIEGNRFTQISLQEIGSSEYKIYYIHHSVAQMLPDL